MLDHGSIVERGTHAELLAARGLYASMWNRQREAEQARETLALVDDDVAEPDYVPPADTEPSTPRVLPLTDVAVE